MPTKIFSANIIIGSDSNQYILERIAIKKLPLHILLSDSSFIQGIIIKVPEGIWKRLPVDKTLKHPNIKIFYLKYLGDVAQEPELPI